MWQELRDYWLPLMLFGGAILVALLLLGAVAATPYLGDQFANDAVKLFAEDATVRRASVAGALGLIVTAFVFFRPNASVMDRKSATRKSRPDRMAGA